MLIVLQLYAHGTLSEPTLTVSPWFEARRIEYYDRLLAVSCAGEWDQWVSFFAQGLEESALTTRGQMLQLVAVQSNLKETVRASTHFGPIPLTPSSTTPWRAPRSPSGKWSEI